VRAQRGSRDGPVQPRIFEVWYFPSKLPELNAVEGCWNQLQEWFKHRLIPDLSTLKEHTPKGINTINEPNIWTYLIGKIRPSHYEAWIVTKRFG
jgi:hypothetical protein